MMLPMKYAQLGLVLAAGASAALMTAPAKGDSVAQVATAKRISRQTVALIDPQGRPVASDAGVTSGTLAQVGDILTFVIQFTPVPNGAYRGLGGYITDYIPPNTEVVGARIVDRYGNTVAPHRGGLACDGYGPRGKGTWTVGAGEGPLTQGSMSQLYADTGIFYSNDVRTLRNSDSGGTPQPFLSLKNGLQMPAAPSGAGQFDQLLNTSAPYFAHNAWDLAQVAEWGPGTGNGPEHVGNMGIGYASPVAGPDSWYQLEVTVDPPGSAVTAANVKYLGNTGPWHRVRQTGSEIGRRGQGDTPPSTNQSTSAYLQCPGGAPTRIGIPTSSGYAVSTTNPLPPDTNAVRFALGELVVGDEYFAEVSLRVKALPLDPSFGNINCAEVAGGDASSRAQNGGTGGKDYLWRYFLPAPACVSLDLLFENNVDKVLATANSTLTYTIDAKNLTTSTMTNVVVKDCFVSGNETLIAAGTTAGYTIDTTGAGCPNPAAQDALVWTVGSLAPGESKQYIVQFTAKASTTNDAVFTSDTFPTPGFVAPAYTTIESIAIMRLALEATPSYVATLPGTVHYTATAQNVGTGAATLIEYAITLPGATWTYHPGTMVVNGVAVAGNPTQSGAILSFVPNLIPATIAAGATQKFEFDVDIPAGTAPDLYTSDLTSWVKSAQDFEDSVFRVAPVAVLTPFSDSPTVSSPILAGTTTVTGKSTEAAGSVVTVYVNGNAAGTGTVDSLGSFSVTVAPLFAGQRIEVTVTAVNELESAPAPSPPVIVVANSSALDPTPKAQCSDGIDNDNDGKIDYPNDPGCCSYLDDLETDDGVACASTPACADGIDNDGDGFTDFPYDPGCTSALDSNEVDVALADGGFVPGDAGTGGGGNVDGGKGRSPDASPPDLGGVPARSGDSGGCGCSVIGASTPPANTTILSLLALLLIRRRTRR